MSNIIRKYNKFISENKYNTNIIDGNIIVYQKDGYKVLVNSEISPNHITLWYNDKKIGTLNVSISERRFEWDDDFEKYYKVSEIDIDKYHRGNGFGKLMYDILIELSGDDIKGLYSYLPNRVNKKQIPSIYKNYDTIISGDNEVILF